MDHTHEGWPVPHSAPIPPRDWEDIALSNPHKLTCLISIPNEDTGNMVVTWSIRPDPGFLSPIHEELYDCSSDETE